MNGYFNKLPRLILSRYQSTRGARLFKGSWKDHCLRWILTSRHHRSIFLSTISSICFLSFDKFVIIWLPTICGFNRTTLRATQLVPHWIIVRLNFISRTYHTTIPQSQGILFITSFYSNANITLKYHTTEDSVL